MRRKSIYAEGGVKGVLIVSEEDLWFSLLVGAEDRRGLWMLFG